MTCGNDPSENNKRYCIRCETALTENNITELSAKHDRCEECYKISVSDRPELLQENIDNIKGQLFNVPPDQKETILENLKVIEEYLQGNYF